MLDYIKDLFGNKKTYTIFMITFIVAVFVVLFLVFFSKEEIKSFQRYDVINIEEKNREIGSKYLDSLIFHARYSNTSEFISKLPKNYLEYTGMTVEQIKNKYFSKKITAFEGLKIYECNEIVVYSTDIVYEDKSKVKMNLVEYKPYNYNITFEDYCIYETMYVTSLQNGIKFEVSSQYISFTTRTLEFEITNISNDVMTIDISNIRNISLELTNGIKYYLTNSQITDDFSEIKKNTTVNKKLTFDIPISTTNSVEKINFNNVNINGKLIDISINL